MPLVRVGSEAQSPWRQARKALGVLALLSALGLLANGLYIPAKAQLAQFLLQRAWDTSQEEQRPVRPWPSADTWPVARLRSPRLGIDQVVLAGASGRVLAFGPGHVRGTAKPGERGNLVLSGHRDTHFAWLRELRSGDRIDLELPDRRRIRYAVLRHQVRDRSERSLLAMDDFDGLRLITCYPFDALLPGSPERFVVDALAL